MADPLPSMSTRLRAPVERDFALLASWIPDAVACRRWAGPGLPFPLSAEDLPSLLGVTDRATFCLDAGAQDMIAFGQYSKRDGGTMHLSRIIVAPAARGRHVGRRLCTALMAHAANATGVTMFSLRVYRDNVAALTVYRQLGFLPVEAESDPEILFMRT